MVQDFNEQDPKSLPDVGAGGSSDGSSRPDSLADQTEEVRRYAAEHGLEIVAEYVDEHRSDVSGLRARFAAMVDEARHRAGAMLFCVRYRLKG